MSILTPILEESTDALFQTLEVEPLVNRTVSNVVMTQALTPEVLERMKALDDPQVQQVLAGFKTNVEKAVQESSQILQTEVANDLGDLLGQVANKLSGAVQSLVADIPGVGVAMAALETADAAVAAVKEGEEVLNGIQSAIEPITAIQHQVAAVTDAVSAATGQLSAATQSAATGQLSAATQSVNDATQSVNDATQSAATPTNRTTRAPTRDVAESDIYQLGGGSRKRRRIHKLSRRIERTLRRVQKKYGLRNKNDFLRRTLRVRKMK
jgi:hypothetical protein